MMYWRLNAIGMLSFNLKLKWSYLKMFPEAYNMQMDILPEYSGLLAEDAALAIGCDKLLWLRLHSDAVS